MEEVSRLVGRRWRVTALSLAVAPFFLGPAHALAVSGPAQTRHECPPLPALADARERAIATVDSLALTLTVPERVGQGEEVRFTLRAENVSGRRLDLYLRGREITFDAVVTHLDGTPVWRRLEGEFPPAILRLEPLAAGGVLEVSGLWNQRQNSGASVLPGAYCLQVELLTEGEPILSPRGPFEIGAGG